MSMAGGTVRETMDKIGDGTMQMVVDHYTRTVPKHQREVVNQLAQSLVEEDAKLARTLKAPTSHGSSTRSTT